MSDPPTTRETESPENTESVPSHNMEGKYAVLQETNGKECESWYYFIKVDGNLDELQYLQTQLETVDWYVLDDLSVFELDLDTFVSAQTAKEMSKIEVNSYMFHRKFDGKLDRIHFGFKKKDNDEDRMVKAFDILGYGQIEDFIDDEDVDDEDLANTDDESDDSDSDGESSSGSEEEVIVKKKGVPSALKNSNLPRWARAKRKGR